MIRILYFASLRERLGRAEETLDAVPADVATLRTELVARGEPWATAFAPQQRVLVAINQAMVDADSPLSDGDEVGFFPPVTGG
ncbi:MAG: molybdopterin converting factor subunit 1 [Gammaproteobacteria bacterium]|nr:molybdopterin converting factor subunit 1 [Gammaproteobacteria bacterium]